MKDSKELEILFGITAEQIAEWDEDALNGKLPGEPADEIIIGRPLKFGVELKSITYKDTSQRIEAMDKRAASLGISRSDYLRYLVRRDLELAGIA